MPVPSTVAISSGQSQGRQHRFTPAELMAAIRQEALSLGLGEDGARVAQAIAQTEGGLTNRMGDVDARTGAFSVGPFQFHYGGTGPGGPRPSGQLTAFANQQTGGDVTVAREKILDDPHRAIRWALQGYLGQAIRQGQAKGLSGPALATYAQRTGQVSESPERAGENYRALGESPNVPADPGVQKAGSTSWKEGMRMPSPEPDVSPDNYRDESLQALNAYIQDLKDAEASLQSRWTRATKQEATAGQRSGDTALSLAEQSQAAREYQIAYNERQRIEKELEANAVAMRQAQRDYATTSRVVSKSLDDYAKRIELAIRAGSLTLAQGKQEWDRALEGANAGVSGLIAGYGALKSFLPSMGNKGMERALFQSIKDWENYGAGPVPDFEFPLIDVDPVGDVRQYLPPAEQVQAQWRKGFDASGGAGGDELLQAALGIVEEGRRRASTARPPADYPGELPSQGWPGLEPGAGGVAGELPSQGYDDTFGASPVPPAPPMPQVSPGLAIDTSQQSPTMTTPALRPRGRDEPLEDYLDYIRSLGR